MVLIGLFFCTASGQPNFPEIANTRSCFGNNRLNNTKLKSLVYSDGTTSPVRVPYASWVSERVVAAVTYILLSEVMQYSAVFVQNINLSVQAVSLTKGCRDPNDALCSDRDFDHPIIHFTSESWEGADIAASSGPRLYQPLLQSILNYDTVDSLFVWQGTVDAGLNSPSPLSLDFYRSYNFRNRPHRFFDPWTRMLELLPANVIMTCSEMGPGSPEDRQADIYTAYTNDTSVECYYDDTVWFSPTCRANTTFCLPVLLQYNYAITMQLAFWLQIPVAIVKVRDGATEYDDAYYGAIRQGNFIFDWYKPDDSLKDAEGRLPTLIVMPAANLYEQAQQLYKTGYPVMNPRNYLWNRLPTVDPFVTYLVSNVGFYDQVPRPPRAPHPGHRCEPARAPPSLSPLRDSVGMRPRQGHRWAAASSSLFYTFFPPEHAYIFCDQNMLILCATRTCLRLSRSGHGRPDAQQPPVEGRGRGPGDRPVGRGVRLAVDAA